MKAPANQNYQIAEARAALDAATYEDYLTKLAALKDPESKASVETIAELLALGYTRSEIIEASLSMADTSGDENTP